MEHHQPGENTYTHGEDIYASVVGQTEIADNCISVANLFSVLRPSNGDSALATVKYITEHQINLEIFAIGSKSCCLPGIIRTEDHKNEPFEIGAIVRCNVLQLQENNIILTTRHPNAGILNKKELATLIGNTASGPE